MQNINIVKIGSDSINKENIIKIIIDAKKRKEKTGEKFIFISSGAVKLGKNRIKEVGKDVNLFRISTLASIGQKFLMKLYGDILGETEIVSEILIDNYADEYHLSKTIENSLLNDIWIIINHNDALHKKELENVNNKTDNDKNVVFISKLLNSFLKDSINIKRTIYLTNTNGLLDDKSETILGGIINDEDRKLYYYSFINNTKSNSGTGGMLSKLKCSFETLDLGAEKSIISNAKNGLECLNNNINSTIFTKQ